VSAAATPWMKFYPQDWRADEKLRLCSLAARGLWMEMLALMHRSERYGQLLINGHVPTDAQLAVQVGASPNEVTALLADLESAGVFSRSVGGAIYSRRMTRDEKKAKIARHNGKAGGNPTLRKQTGNSPQDNGQDKASVKGEDKLSRVHKPEARDQSPERTPKPPSLPGDLQAVMEIGGYVSPPGDHALLKQWYAAGADLQQDILPVIGREAASMKQRAGPPRTLKIFDSAIREKLAADAAEIERLRGISRRYETIEEQERAAAAGGQR
jgi:hypothetical protein